MSDKSYDGGPAFPGEQGHTPDGTWNQTWEPGMSLRDWFAGQALAGVMSDNERYGASYRDMAYDAYAAADAMLEARKGG